MNHQNPVPQSPSPFGEASAWFSDAIEIIDARFGTDYARKNPNLLTAVLNALATASKQ